HSNTPFPYTTLFRSEAGIVDRLGVLRNEAERLLAREAPRIERLVTVVVPAFEPGDRLGRRLQRPMRRGVREPREERPAVAPILRSEEHTSELQSREN